MTKSKRNLLVSVLVLILTVAIAGGSTYAWFTTNLNVKVNDIDINVTTGSKGLYVSTSPDTGFKTYLSNTDLINAGFTLADIKFNAVSSPDGKTMKLKSDTTPGGVGAAAADTAYYDFAVYFRATGSAEADVPKIFLSSLAMTKVGTNNEQFYNGVEKEWVSATYGKTSGTAKYAPGAEIKSDAVHSARMSFQSEPYLAAGYKTVIGTPDTAGNAGTTLRVWDPYKEDNTTFRGTGTDTTAAPTKNDTATADWNKVVVSNFSLQYFDELTKAQAGVDGKLPTYGTDAITLPDTQFGATAYNGTDAVTAKTAFNADVLRLAWNGTSKAHEGKLIVRIWLEGYDGDCNNAILADSIRTSMMFTILQTAKA